MSGRDGELGPLGGDDGWKVRCGIERGIALFMEAETCNTSCIDTVKIHSHADFA